MTREELFNTVTAYAHRADAASLLPTFLELAEQRIATNIRAEEMVTYTSIDTEAEAEVNPNAWALPADFLQMVDVNVTASGNRRTPVRSVSRSAIQAYSFRSGPPVVYSVYDGVIELRPGPLGREVNLIYYARPAPLVNDSDTNQLLQNYPGLYLNGMLHELWVWAQEREQRAEASNMFQAEMATINRAAWNARFGHAGEAQSGYNYSARGARN